MVEKEYKFTCFIPDMDDVNALISTETEFFKKEEFAEYRKGMSDVALDRHLFACGFNRGCAWMIYKMKEKNNGR